MRRARAWMTAMRRAMGLMAASLQPALADGHRGGTLRLLSAGSGRNPRPEDQLHAAILAGLPVRLRRACDLQACRRRRGLHHRAGSRRGDAGAPGRRQDLCLQAAQGHQVLRRPEVTVKDVVASFQRIFKVSSPTAGSFYNGIVGADACLKTPATCTLDGGVVGDEAAGTVTINLVAPDAEFFDKLAVPHAVDPAGRYAGQGHGQHADRRHRRLHVRRLRSRTSS